MEEKKEVKPKKKRITEYERWQKFGLVGEKLFLIESLAMEGKTDKEIAQELMISVNTLSRMKKEHYDVYQVLSKTKRMVDYQIEKSLYQKAKEGDVNAIKFWLMNRKSDIWKERRNYEHNVSKSVIVIDGEEELED